MGAYRLRNPGAASRCGFRLRARGACENQWFMNPAEQAVPPVVPQQLAGASVLGAPSTWEGVPPRALGALRTTCQVLLLAVCLLAVLALSPVLLVLRAAAPLLPGPARGVARLVLLSGAYLLTCEVRAVTTDLRLRLARGRGSDDPSGRGDAGAVGHGDANRAARDAAGLDLVRRSTGAFFGPGLRAVGMPLRCPEPPHLDPTRPVVVLLRHAGLLNMQLGTYLAAHVLRRRTHGICKSAAVALPGAAAIVRGTSLVPLRWNAEGRARAGRELTAAGGRLGPGDAAVVLPEGTNFSVRRRRARIARLRRRGRQDLAASAEAMPHVLPPIVQGTAALLAAAPNAQVLVVGHTGLEDVLPWRLGSRYPANRDGACHLSWRSYGPGEVPREPEAFGAWLYERWRELDAWVSTVRTAGGDRPGLPGAAPG